jgi:lipoate-protein ligase A
MAQCKAAAPPTFPQLLPLPPFSLWIDETPRPGWANMAVDLALLDRAERLGESWLRLYCWDPHCLSFGRHEPAIRRYDAELIRALGLDTVRRPTGGRAVWHARELTYAVASPSARFGSLCGAYQEIHRMLAEALGTLGVDASLAPPNGSAPLDAGACFSRPVGGEVLASGRKVIGSAQLRRGTGLLQHGSILLHDDQHQVAAVLRESSIKFSQPATTGWALTDDLGRPLRTEAVAAAIAGTASDRWGGNWEKGSTPNHVLRAAAVHYPQFRSSAWTWGR